MSMIDWWKVNAIEYLDKDNLEKNVQEDTV